MLELWRVNAPRRLLMRPALAIPIFNCVQVSVLLHLCAPSHISVGIGKRGRDVGCAVCGVGCFICPAVAVLLPCCCLAWDACLCARLARYNMFWDACLCASEHDLVASIRASICASIHPAKSSCCLP